MENKKSNNKVIIIAAVVITVMIAAIVGMICLYSASKDKPVEGSKTITVQVIAERDSYNFEEKYKTDDEFLGDLLEEKDLITFDKTEYGRFITAVQGHESNNDEQSWWSVAVDGESAMTGVDEIVLTDGSVYTLELKIGW